MFGNVLLPIHSLTLHVCIGHYQYSSTQLSHHFISVLWGPGIEQQHALVENRFGNVTLSPVNEAMCAVNGVDIQGPTALTQGKLS